MCLLLIKGRVCGVFQRSSSHDCLVKSEVSVFKESCSLRMSAERIHPLVADIEGFKRPRIYDRRAVHTDAQVSSVR